MSSLKNFYTAIELKKLNEVSYLVSSIELLQDNIAEKESVLQLATGLRDYPTMNKLKGEISERVQTVKQKKGELLRLVATNAFEVIDAM